MKDVFKKKRFWETLAYPEKHNKNGEDGDILLQSLSLISMLKAVLPILGDAETRGDIT